MLKTFTLSALATLATCTFAQDAAVVLKPDGKAIPALAKTLYSDAAISIFGFTPSVDVLLGYDAAPAAEQAMLGYQVVWNKDISPNTTAFVGVAYLAPIGEVRLDRLVDKVGLSVGIRLRL